jgi:hypothetical protein
MECEKFVSTGTSLFLKDLKEREKCIFMIFGRGRCQNGRRFELKRQLRLGGSWQHWLSLSFAGKNWW